MTGNGHARFLGGRAAATPLLLPGKAVYMGTEESKEPKDEVRQVFHGQDGKVREMRSAETFLDDKLLPSTSNAVERGNRRYRKMQNQVYRVRTQMQISARLALDMWREAHAEGRQQTLTSLHRARAG